MPVPLRANANRAEAKYNVVTDFPNYELHSAAASGNQGLVEYALARGQPVNSVLDGVLPLHAACAGGHEQVVKLLIDHGADVNAARLPRRYSNEKNRDASAPIAGTTGSTPLHFAAANGNESVINLLLLRGAHADRRDKNGITPAMLAEQHGWIECAQVLNNWVKEKDRDLRERGQPQQGESTSILSPNMTHSSSSTYHDDDNKPRKHIQVKRSIDTALNVFKTGTTSSPHSKLSINPTSSANNLRTLSSTSPTRNRRDFSPSPSEDGRYSPSPSPIDPGSRRPSLPHILPTPPNSSQKGQKIPSTKSKQPRRPRSAGTDAEQDDANNAAPGSGGAGKKLGTKYSLLNLFKKGNESGNLSLERTTSHQSTTSITLSPSLNPSARMINSPKQTTSSLSDTGPLPTAGYRFGSSNDTSLKTRATPSPSNTRTSPSMSSYQQPYVPPIRPSIPSAVDLHNALASNQPLPNRHRSESSSSANRYDPPIGLGITFDEGDASLNRRPMRRLLSSDVRHSRDRSASNASNRNAAVFDDEVVITSRPNNGSSGNVSVSESVSGGTGRNNSRPSILRGHNRTSSGQQRALRFDSSASVVPGSGVIGRRESDAQPPRTITIPLRGCISAGSLNRLHNERNGSPRLLPMTLNGDDRQWRERVPDSAPPNVSDFEQTEYGQPIGSSIVARTRLDIQTRNRGLSITSSESSLSPALSAGDPTVTSALHAEFPFSIDAPPPIDGMEESEGTVPVQLQVSSPPISPADGDSRIRGDSVSSGSTDGANPALSASETTSGSGGSGAIPTPMVSPEGGSHLSLPGAETIRLRKSKEKADVPEVARDEFEDSETGPTQSIAIRGLSERRGQSTLETLDVSHAQAEALVQRTQQDILSAHADGQASSGVDLMPLSARLAALGESLELERRLREQKKAQELKGKAGVVDQVSSRTKDDDQPVKSPQNTRANSEGSRNPGTPLFERNKTSHHPSLSASVVETTSPAFESFESDVDSPVMQPKWSERVPARARTPDPDNDLSRISSLEGFDDTELGPSLFRVSTAPNSLYSRDKRERELASNTKLTRMGFSPNETGRGGVQQKRFGLKSLMQSLKGKP